MGSRQLAAVAAFGSLPGEDCGMLTDVGAKLFVIVTSDSCVLSGL